VHDVVRFNKLWVVPSQFSLDASLWLVTTRPEHALVEHIEDTEIRLHRKPPNGKPPNGN
jgi:hypothetical protein